MTLASPVADSLPRSARAERSALALGVVAAVVYNSWPLGFWLDRAGMRGTYVSVLEVPGRRDAHLFVTCDVLAGLLAVVAGLLLRRSRGPAAWGPAAWGLVIFGVGNVLEASIPIDATCAVSVASCGTGPGAMFAPHDIASLISLAGLAIALWSLREHSRWMQAVIGLWILTGLFMVISVVVVRWVTVSQTSFIVACGVALAAVPLPIVLPPVRSLGRRGALPPADG